MLISHQGRTPDIDPSAYVAPSATICGDVTIGPHCRIMHGACIIAEGGRVALGRQGIVLENAVVRSNSDHHSSIGNFCLIGPNAHVVGCTIEDEVFIATGAAIFHSARLGRGSQVRINAVVHLKTRLEPGTIVPIGWVAVGDPARLFSPDRHEDIWAIQKPLNFPLTVYGMDRPEASMEKITSRLADKLGTHRDDTVITEP